MTGGTVRTGGLNLRAGVDPGTVVKVLRKGSRVEILGEETWLRVRTRDGTEGFVFGDFVDRDVSNGPVAATAEMAPGAGIALSAAARLAALLAETAHWWSTARRFERELCEALGYRSIRFALRLGGDRLVTLRPGELRPLAELASDPLDISPMAPLFRGAASFLVYGTGEKTWPSPSEWRGGPRVPWSCWAWILRGRTRGDRGAAFCRCSGPPSGAAPAERAGAGGRGSDPTAGRQDCWRLTLPRTPDRPYPVYEQIPGSDLPLRTTNPSREGPASGERAAGRPLRREAAGVDPGLAGFGALPRIGAADRPVHRQKEPERAAAARPGRSGRAPTGVAAIPLSGPGTWYVKFIHMARLDGDGEADYESTWASLSFAVR